MGVVLPQHESVVSGVLDVDLDSEFVDVDLHPGAEVLKAVQRDPRNAVWRLRVVEL